MDKIMIQYLHYLKEMCGFSARTIKYHTRICKLWTTFLDEQDQDVGAAKADDFLCYIEGRTKKVSNTSLAGELCVLRTFVSVRDIWIKV